MVDMEIPHIQVLRKQVEESRRNLVDQLKEEYQDMVHNVCIKLYKEVENSLYRNPTVVDISVMISPEEPIPINFYKYFNPECRIPAVYTKPWEDIQRIMIEKGYTIEYCRVDSLYHRFDVHI